MGLKGVIGFYLNNALSTDESGRFYFGVLSELSTDQREGEKAILLENEDIFNGYLVSHSGKKEYGLTYSTDEENLDLNISPQQATIHVNPHQITKSELILPQSATKSDWVTPKSIEVVIPGDYFPHIKCLEKAIQDFEKGDKPQLWLPNFMGIY